ncbi:MAG: hypothetical protein LQ351_006219 [Letrouitia transgressa]|nr:MAG: hypothetical protein LQ351_006219 [Letrouitia transgressa]
MAIAYLALELDVNLFDDHELYDINIIGSLFKAWLRDLPTEILPKAVQEKYLEEEYRVLDGHGDNDDGLGSSGGDSSQGSTAVAEERSLPSSGSSKHNIFGSRKLPPLNIPDTREQQPSYSSGHTRSASQLPELQPMVPLSPIGL